ncbi:MAG TPA: hypothetical protein VHU23_06790 [Rhizomicrobium sp.]|jgi:cytochrome c5|nr:hypothetical protein [Rhizomicrobium sp.]
MRIFAVLAVSAAAVLTPALASADPGQTQTAPAATATTAPSTPALQQTAQATPATAAPSSNSDEIVCRTQPPTTGTRLGATRECHTQRDWDRRQEETQKMVQQTQLQGMSGLAGPGVGKGK